jgi:spermidine synthase
MPSNETALPIDRRLSFFVVSLFFLSGCFALIYQVSWVRAVTLEFGSTTLAVSTVVTIFLGGLALGAWLVGGRADHWRRPLAAYGLLELVLAAYTLLTPRLFEALLPEFSRLAYGFSDSVLVLSLIRFAGAGVLLLPPTILMGATLPVLVRFWTLRALDSGRWAGLLYGINTTGAFVGTVLGGFWLLPTFGLQATVYAVGAFCPRVGGYGARERSERSSLFERRPVRPRLRVRWRHHALPPTQRAIASGPVPRRARRGRWLDRAA